MHEAKASTCPQHAGTRSCASTRQHPPNEQGEAHLQPPRSVTRQQGGPGHPVHVAALLQLRRLRRLGGGRVLDGERGGYHVLLMGSGET